MLDRYTIELITNEFDSVINSYKSSDGDWIKFEDFRKFLIIETCLDYFRTPENSEKWLDENGTELLSFELNSIKDVKNAIVTINQRKNKNEKRI